MTDSRETLFTAAWRFAVVVSSAIVVLGVLNALPQFLGGEPLGVVRYASVEQAEAHLGVRLYRPAALPGDWRWPPSTVRLAVGEPDWVQFVFEQAGGGRAAGGNVDDGTLVLCQALGASPRETPVPAVLLPQAELLQADDVSVDGRRMRLQRVLLDDGTILHELWWRDGPRRVMLRGRVPADSLPAIARSISGIGQ